MQVCREFINIIMGNNQLHKSGDNSKLFNVATKGFTLLSRILFELILFVLLWIIAHLQL